MTNDTDNNYDNNNNTTTTTSNTSVSTYLVTSKSNKQLILAYQDHPEIVSVNSRFVSITD
ncbi:MAG: hypothetical protein ACTHJ2_07465 [Candidatus Nitrosocosmicus sp.]